MFAQLLTTLDNVSEAKITPRTNAVYNKHEMIDLRTFS